MKSILTPFVFLISLIGFAQLQNPDICIGFFGSGGNFLYSGHQYFTYDAMERETVQVGIDTVTGDSLYRFETSHISASHFEQVSYRPDVNGKLVKKDKYERETSANGVDHKAISYEWINGMWEVKDYSARWLYLYNSQNEMTECIQEQYQSWNGGWKQIYRTSYSHNGTYQVIIENHIPDGNGGWSRIGKREQTNNTSIITEKVSSVDPQTNVATLTEYNTYTPNGLLNIDVTHPNPYLHDFEGNASESTHDVYDANANLQLFEKKLYSTKNDTSIVLTQRYNDSLSMYEDYQRSTVVNDVKDQRILGEIEIWNGTLWEINSGFKTQRTYNGNKETENVSQQYNSITKQYENYTKSLYKFTRPIGLGELDFNWSIGPNPASDRLNVKLLDGAIITLTFYDLHGKLIISATNFQNSGWMDLSRLAPGTYMIEVRSDNNAHQILKQVISR